MLRAFLMPVRRIICSVVTRWVTIWKALCWSRRILEAGLWRRKPPSSKATEMVLYRTCKRMIERGSTDGLAEKIDIFYAAGKLTDEHYAELTGMLAEKKEQV